MTSWFRDIYHPSNHLFSGACSVDGEEQGREQPRVPQTRWRSEGPLRDDEEDEELILNEV